MTKVSERDPQLATAEVAQADRRRPGRLPQVSPELIPLLRGEAVPEAELEPRFGNPDQLAAARGVIIGLALSVPLWAAIGLAGRWIIHAL